MFGEKQAGKQPIFEEERAGLTSRWKRKNVKNEQRSLQVQQCSRKWNLWFILFSSFNISEHLTVCLSSLIPVVNIYQKSFNEDIISSHF